MFKRNKEDKTVQGVPSAPYSNTRGCAAAIIIVCFGIWCFFNPVEVVKWVGYPFMIIPDAVGLVDRPTKAEIGRVVGQQGTVHEIELTRTGVYYLHRSFWDSWGTEPGQYPRISLEGPNGPVVLNSLETRISEEPVNPYEPDSPVPRLSLFYPPQAPGLVKYWFEVSEPGLYIARYSQTDDRVRKKFDASLAPEYLHGHETAVRLAFGIQLTIIVLIFGIWLYFRKIKPGLSQLDKDVDSQLKKRDSMDDFLTNIK